MSKILRSKILRGCLKITMGVILIGAGFYWGTGRFLCAVLGREFLFPFSVWIEGSIAFLIILTGAFCALGGLYLLVLGFIDLRFKGGVR